MQSETRQADRGVLGAIGGFLFGLVAGIVVLLDPELIVPPTVGKLVELVVHTGLFFGWVFGLYGVFLGLFVGAIVGFVWGFRRQVGS